ncbi:conserved hypothetical protein [Lachnospiraceae bacterium C7]|nr:conserved hypothetical protein [Lachnospiraceae bacterium C7]
MQFKTKNDNKIFRLEEKTLTNGVKFPLLKYHQLEELGIVEHCFTTREGGVSQGVLSSLNLSFTRGDDKENVIENYKRLAEALDVEITDFVLSDQTHTTNVRRVYKKDAGCGIVKELPYHDVDGLITNEKGLVLSTFYADCVPLYFVDTVNKAIGLSHSGWRGTVNRMGKATIEAMTKEFGTNPADVVAAVGPSICSACYEVSEDVADEFKKSFAGHENEILTAKADGKYLLDLWKANEIVFLDAGIKKENIAITNICTSCNKDLLFSHRATKGKRGNLGAFMYLK